MRRNSSKRRKATQSPYEALCDLARQIVSEGHLPGKPDFFTLQAEELLIKTLPLGLDKSLERLRAFRVAPSEYPDELGHLMSISPVIVSFVTLEAEGALAAYIEKPKWMTPRHPAIEAMAHSRLKRLPDGSSEHC